MINYKRISVLIVVFCLHIIQNQIFGATENVNGRLQGVSNLVQGAQLIVIDEKYFDMLANPTTWSDHYTNHKIKNRIIVGINHDVPVFVSSSVTKCFKLTITYQNPGSTPVTFTKNMTITFDNTGNFDDKAVFEFYGGQYLTVSVNNITDDCSQIVSSTVENNMYVQAEVEVERYYKLYKSGGPDALTANSSLIETNSSLEITWNYIEGAEEFDLEWTYVNNVDEDGDYALALEDIAYDFRNNSTRITTTNNFYSIPLIFEGGYIVYRVRGVGRGGADFSSRIDGEWTIADEIGVLDDLTSLENYHTINWTYIEDHQNKNWQYIANFAEDGKRKESVSFFDGSLRNRQSVAKSNSNNVAIVGQTIYDYQGRPAIQVLPTPSNEPILKYYEKYNQNSSGDEYTKIDFDLDDELCETVSPPMRSDELGSSNYYSADNPDLDDENAYIPDARGFPFSQVEYTPDNTGRIRAQGGVGEEFQLEHSHETKYYYAKPFIQEELDRLFGSEVGYKSHYKKNMVMDANGQVSVTYLDMQGRTIATFLSGNPENTEDVVDAIKNESEAGIYSPDSYENVDLLNKDDSGDIDDIHDENHIQDGGKSLVFEQEFVVTNEETYEFNYSLVNSTFEDDCLEFVEKCLDCVYDLTIDLKDECGVSQGSFPLTQTIGNTENAITCENFTLPPESLLVELPIGQYSLIKKLTINQDALDFYKKNYIEYIEEEGSSCIIDSATLFAQQLDSLELYSPCEEIDCETCETSLPTEEEYIEQNFPDYSTLGEVLQDSLEAIAEYKVNRMIQECREMCDNYMSLCEINLKRMLNDVSPEGQYGKIGTDVTNYWLSVYNVNNRLPRNVVTVGSYTGGANWKNPVDLTGALSPYLDENGNPYKVYVYKNADDIFMPEVDVTPYLTDDPDVGIVYPKDLTNLSDFINIWRPEWANNLVFYHPEFGYYESCEDLVSESCVNVNDLTSDQFDELIFNTNSYADALTALGATHPINHQDILDLDPFVSSTCTTLTNYGTNLSTSLSDYRTTGYDLSEITSITVQCGNNYNTGTSAACTSLSSSDTEVRNAYWTQLKSSYLAEKQHFQSKRADVIATEKSSYSGCIGKANWSYWENPLMLSDAEILPLSGVNVSNSHFVDVNASAVIADIVDPCSYFWKHLYTGKTRVWGSPSDYLEYESVEDLQSETECQYFQQTGQCPVTSDFENLLNALLQNNQLYSSGVEFFDATIPKVNYPEFTLSLFEALGGDDTEDNDFTSSGSISGPGDELTLIFESAHADPCTTSVYSSSYDFNDISNPIIELKNLKATGTSTFSVEAVVDVGATEDPENYVTIILSGSTCLVLNACECNLVCTPTSEAIDLVELMNALLISDDDEDLTSDFSDTDFEPFDGTANSDWYSSILSNSLLNYFGGLTSYTDLTWDNSSNTIFTIADTSSNDIVIETEYALSSPEYIVSIEPNSEFYDSPPTSTYNAILIYFNGTVYVSVRALITYNDGDEVFIGVCNDPSEINCQTDEHQLLSDIKGFFEFLFDNLSLLDGDIHSLDGYVALTPLMQNYLNESNSYNEISLLFESIDSDHSAIHFLTNVACIEEECTYDVLCSINFNSLYVPDGYDFTSISNVEMVVDEENLTNGSALGFTLFLESSEGKESEALLYGQSTCFPLANCMECNEVLETELAVNGSFEDYVESFPTETEHGIDECSYVSSPNTGTPFYLYFDEAEPTAYSAFQYTCGDDNHGMVGIATYYSLYPNRREYIQVPFSSPLIADNYYFISYTVKYLTVPDIELPAVYIPSNGIGAYVGGELTTLTTPNILTPTYGLDHIADHFALNGAVIDNSTNCTTISFKYKARGGEDVVIIGNFLPTDQMTFVYPEGEPVGETVYASYYLIDNVSVKEIGCKENIELPGTLPEVEDPCEDYKLEVAENNANIIYQEQIRTLVDSFEQEYIAHCMSQAVETFDVSYESGDYQFTLYYYDQAGNLVRTVPPKGVELLTGADLIGAKAYRSAGGTFIPTTHTMQTTYTYNSLNQLIKQNTPDGGTTLFWYDELGRLVLSQNAQQLETGGWEDPDVNIFSYTVYDALGRITEVGEVWAADEDYPTTTTGFINDTELDDILTGDKYQVTRTYYDETLSSTISNLFSSSLGQENLRNRVAAVTYEDVNDNVDLTYTNATHYSYDYHGNVKTLLQQVPKDALYHQEFKRVDYEYDLVSGNVNKVSYQAGKPDQYYHKYEYDADNRITNVFTSKDHIIWDEDGRYFYYKHGPLARMEIGNEKVQAIDYAYTLQGWIKGVNSNILNPNNDIGKDGKAGSTNLNQNIARDAYSYSLSYYNGATVGAGSVDDYLAIGNPTDDFLAALPTATGLSTFDRNLYNGNIKHMVTTLSDLDPLNAIDDMTPLPQATAYRYDQLNRLVGMEAYNDLDLETNEWGTLTSSDPYKIPNITYDQNGNIYKLHRKGAAGNTDMDELEYFYYGSDDIAYAEGATLPTGVTLTNKLAYVDDNDTYASNYETDIDAQPTDNYTYDRIGNLRGDLIEGISYIDWNVYGKIKSINRFTTFQENLTFTYDASGNRIEKVAKPQTSGVEQNEEQWTRYKYKKDASGNTMALYKQTFENISGDHYKSTITVEENPIYGSSRIGVDDKNTAFVTHFLADFDSNGELDPSLASGNVQFNVTDAYRIMSDSGMVITGDTDVVYTIYTLGDSLFISSTDTIVVIDGEPDTTTYNSITNREIQEISFVTSGDVTINNYRQDFELEASQTYEITSDGPVSLSDALLVKGKIVTHTVGNKAYELTNHLGNVLSTVSDRKVPVESTTTSGELDYYTADISTISDYYPFGSVMPGRSYSSGDYRYGFNGKESDNEVSGNGNSYDYGFRIYNPRIGKFLSRDPLSKNYPHLTPYQFASNTPIQASDLDGLEAIQEIQYVYEGTSIATVTNYWLESNDERVQLILHDLGTGTTSEIWYNPVEIKYEPSSSEKFLAGVQKVNNTVNDFNNSIRNIPQKMDGLQSSMMGNTYGELEGEQGLIKSNDAAKNVGLVLLASPAYPVGEGILLFTDIVESGLDFKNKPFKEALGNTVIRASMFGTGESLSIFKSSVFKPNGGFEEAVDRLTHMGAEALENKTTDELIKTKKDGGGKAQE